MDTVCRTSTAGVASKEWELHVLKAQMCSTANTAHCCTLAPWCCRLHLGGHGRTPTNENPTNHEENLTPTVDEDIRIRVGFAGILHGKVTTSTSPKNCLLAQDDEDGTREGQE